MVPYHCLLEYVEYKSSSLYTADVYLLSVFRINIIQPLTKATYYLYIILTNAIVFEDLCANYMNLILSMNYECILLDDTTHLYIYLRLL